MIGLCGAHRTGKTTLAKAFAQQADIPFVETSASQVFKEMGLDPSVDYPFDVRLSVQEQILKVFAKEYAKYSGVFVTDRTPIDMMAYTLADVRQSTLTSEQETRLRAYCEACVRLTNKHFSILVVVQPGIKAVHAEGKASLSRGYIDHCAAVIMGLVVMEDISASHFYIPKKMLSVQERVACINHVVRKVTERHQAHMQEAKERGHAVVLH